MFSIYLQKNAISAELAAKVRNIRMSQAAALKDKAIPRMAYDSLMSRVNKMDKRYGASPQYAYHKMKGNLKSSLNPFAASAKQLSMANKSRFGLADKAPTLLQQAAHKIQPIAATAGRFAKHAPLAAAVAATGYGARKLLTRPSPISYGNTAEDEQQQR